MQDLIPPFMIWPDSASAWQPGGLSSNPHTAEARLKTPAGGGSLEGTGGEFAVTL